MSSTCLPRAKRRASLLAVALWLAVPVAVPTAQGSHLPRPAAAGYPKAWAEAAPMLTPRSYLAVARGLDGRIFAIGGYDPSGRPLKTVEAYDAHRNSWSLRAPLSSARAALAAAISAKGVIYAIGGLNAARSPLNTVEAYDPRTNSWSRRTPMPTARGDLAAVTGRDGKIYAIGGWKGRGRALGTVEAYNPASNTWSKRASLPLPQLPFPKHDLAATLGRDGKIDVLAWGDVGIYDPSRNSWTIHQPSPGGLDEVIALAAVTGSNGTIYAIGGHRSTSEMLPQAPNYVAQRVETYHAGAQSWTTGPPMPTVRYGLAGVVGSNGKIYVFGGRNQRHLSLRTVEVYDPRLEPWTAAAPLPRVTTISRDLDLGPSAAAVRGPGGAIYALLGGADATGSATTLVQAYDPRTNRWASKASLPAPVSFAPLGRFGAVAGRDGKIYVVGSDKGDRVEAYDPHQNRWSARAPIPLQLDSLRLTVGSDGRIYTFGYPPSFKLTIEVYDPVTDTWALKKELSTASGGLKPYASASAADGKIYLFGPQTLRNYARVVDVYDPRANTWASKGSMPDLRGTQAAVTAADGRIYVLGGAISTTVPLAAYDPRSNRWTMQAPAPVTRRNLAAAAGPNGKIYVLGGSFPFTNMTARQVDVFPVSKAH